MPKLLGKAGGVYAVAQMPQMRHRRLVADQPGRVVRSIDCSSVRTRAMGAFRFEICFVLVIPGWPEGPGPESIRGHIRGEMDSGLALRAPRNDGKSTPPADRGCAWRRCRA